MTNRRPLLLAATAALLLTACESAVDQRPAEARYPVQVTSRAFQAEVPLSAARDGALPADFEAAYRRSGQGPMRLLAPPGHDGREAARKLARALEKRLIQTTIDTSHALDGTVQATYEAAVALVPECGDWSDGSVVNPARAPWRNFGCAYQRNIGLMVSDPTDLVEAPPLPAAEAPRTVGVIGAYRSGEPTGARTPMGEIIGITDTAGGQSQ